VGTVCFFMGNVLIFQKNTKAQKMNNKKQARFYMGYFYALDNFSAFQVTVGKSNVLNCSPGCVFSTAEHFYQWAKFFDPDTLEDINHHEIRDSILKASSAHEAKEIASKNRDARRKDWDSVKINLMEEVLLAKFKQHSYVRRTIARSFGREIVGDSPEDGSWGIAWKFGSEGQNYLGRIWMDIRDREEFQLREEFPEEFV